MDIGNSDNYQKFIKNIFYFSREETSPTEPSYQTLGNIYFQDIGRIIPIYYGNNYIYANSLTTDISNSASPTASMIGKSPIESIHLYGNYGNFEQDLLSVKFPYRQTTLN
jgi:hypothetical protein